MGRASESLALGWEVDAAFSLVRAAPLLTLAAAAAPAQTLLLPAHTLGACQAPLHLPLGLGCERLGLLWYSITCAQAREMRVRCCAAGTPRAGLPRKPRRFYSSSGVAWGTLLSS